MIKRAIGIATLLLVVLGVGIVVTNASPRAQQFEAANQHLYVAVKETRGLVTVGHLVRLAEVVASDRRLGLADVRGRRVQVGVETVDVFDEAVERRGGGEMPDRFVGDKTEDLRRVLGAGVLRVTFGVRDQGDNFYLHDRRNHAAVTRHLRDSNLAVRTLRVPVPCQPEDVSSRRSVDGAEKFLVFKTAALLKVSPVDRVPAASALTRFGVSSVKALGHEYDVEVDRLVREGAVNVNEYPGDPGLAVA